MTDLIITSNKKLNNLERRTLARAEMAHYPALDLYRYLLVSSHVRRIRIDGKVYHSVIDALNIVDDFENEPRKFLADFKKRLKDSFPELSDSFRQYNLPSWDNQKWYKTDVIDTGFLFWLIAESRSELARDFKVAFAEMLNRNPQLEHERIASMLDKETSWIGTEITLLMQTIYEVGDYDEPPYQAKEWKK